MADQASDPSVRPIFPLTGVDFTQVLGIADALPMPICTVDREQRYLFCNRAFAEFFERKRSEILGRRIADVLWKEAYEARRPMIEAALAGERQWFAADIEHPSRGPLALQTEYIPQARADGTVRSIVMIIQDVTEQRVAERALRESEARFRRIADSAPVMMWVTRRDQKREFVNDAYLEFTGLTRAEVNTHEWRDFIHADDWERLVAESIAGEASLQPFTLEARYKRHDGAWRWLRSVSRPRFGPDGELLGFIGAAFDITLAKQGEEQLKALVAERTAEVVESEERLRAIFNSVQELIVLMAPDGSILHANRTEFEWRASDLDRVVGLKLWEAPTAKLWPDQGDFLRDAIAAAARGVAREGERVLIRPNGKKFTLDFSFRPVRDSSGAIAYILFEARDITELRGTQEQLRQSQKMEALGQLTGGIAHDFNNLLTVVVGGLDMIAKRESDPKLQRYAKNALEAAERGARLTAQLLAFSRVQRLEVRPTLVGPLIEHMRPLLRNVLGPGITKEFELDQSPIPVLADPTQLELAILNLAINARDAMPNGGRLLFRTRKMAIGNDDPELAPGQYVEFSITDTGEGMPADVAERAFEPFFTTKEVGKGTGLGLSMVYGVARQSGGTARIVSQAGEGTTVQLYFRSTEAAAEPLGESSAETGHQGAKVDASVLVVDDDPDVREFVTATLEDLGYRVRSAQDGREGLRQYLAEQADVVILDYIMPGLTGADVAAEIRRIRPQQPLLFVSGYSETEAIKRAAPGAALLSKPFRAEALDEAVRTALTAAA
ncbi:PAS domain S-box protein [Sphingomonas sp. KRR8]|uniref:hybrid sensor histidine kinase/response regulator n=1 Tax=Sphingomonas sp. KRR8 TaxID=2942996 RepID=UPI002020659A|nr:PAS domain S-box protein [Sphingomonas sp. KRR8]URD60412.1 PAS domain S-box protein [Sphingomonas sp. KRR8]